MEIAFMYYNNSKEMGSVEKIEKFISQYERKYKVEPDTCHVNDEEYQENKDALDEMSIKIIPDNRIRRGYYWIGIEDANFHFYFELKSKKDAKEKEEEILYG